MGVRGSCRQEIPGRRGRPRRTERLKVGFTFNVKRVKPTHDGAEDADIVAFSIAPACRGWFGRGVDCRGAGPVSGIGRNAVFTSRFRQVTSKARFAAKNRRFPGPWRNDPAAGDTRLPGFFEA